VAMTHTHTQAFDYFLKIINKHEIKWALTGSFRLYLESSVLFNPNDIDIITDKEGFLKIKELFKDKIITVFKFIESGNIKSTFGQLSITNVTFDVMSEVQNKINNTWIEIPNLDKIDFIEYNKIKIPVLPLSIELEVSKLLKQPSKNFAIKKLLYE
jgi:hypothetical protein